MRCLRCALDYPQGVLFCDRCGRHLSHPPGTKVDRDDLAAVQDNSFLYSTHAPPAAYPAESRTLPYTEAVHLDFGQSRAASTDLDYPVDFGYGDDESAGMGLPADEWAHDADDASEELDDDPLTSAIFQLRASLTQQREDEAPAATGTASRRAGSATLARSGRGAAFAEVLRRAPASPRLLAGIVVVIIIVVLGGLVFHQHAGYTNDLQQAQALQAAGQYGSALTLYRKAEGEWPAHDAASAGETAVLSRIATDQAASAQATAVVQAHVAVDLARTNMYQAKLAERRLATQQQASTSPPQP